MIATTPESVTVEEETQAFWLMRARTVRTVARQMMSGERFRLSIVIVLSALLWIGVFQLLDQGFIFLQAAIPHAVTREQMLHTVLATFFGALMAMLLFSAGIILYGSLFRSREIGLLLTLPARESRVFLHKFQEAALLSSWGFLLLGSPLLLAYGIAAGAPWYYFAMLPVLMMSFTYIPVAMGGIVCVLLVRYLPGARKYLLWIGGAVLVGLAGRFSWWLLINHENNLLTPGWFQEMTGRLQFTQYRLLPSWWLSAALFEAAHDNWSESLKFAALMVANALFFRQLAIWTAIRAYRPAYSALQGTALVRRRARFGRIDGLLRHLLMPLPPPMRVMMIKDLRLFRRDPVQWLQFLIFLGLLALYFINIRPFSYDAEYAGLVNVVSFLNLSVVGLLMATFTTRFIYPMISLEGRHFWLLGLFPVRRDVILWSKFAFAVGGSILPCSALILLSDVMLRISPLVAVSHQLTCLILCFGLSGIAVGLGARLPNLREQSPSRIAAGFGGTLNLVLSTLYILVIVLLTALPCHFYLAAASSTSALSAHVSANLLGWLRISMICGSVGSIVLGLLATILPLRIGFRAFRRLEF
jgi:ABC-2 type transport system permease protein